MFLDSETNQFEYFLDSLDSKKIITIGGNFYCNKILKCFNQPSLIINNSGHDKLPPDFYSEELNIMFDLFEVVDSERSVGKNPTKDAERTMETEVASSYIAQEISDIKDKLFCTDLSWKDDRIHKLDFYIKHIQRVRDKHLTNKKGQNKIQDIWRQQHPNITRKGFLIFDGTENFSTGTKIHSPLNPLHSCIWMLKEKPIFYEPWRDENIMKPIYDSDIDFIIWFAPYKPYSGEIVTLNSPYFPEIVVIDTRYSSELIRYDYKEFSRC